MKRRDLVKLLAVGAVGGGGYIATTDSDPFTTAGNTSNTDQSSIPDYDTVVESLSNRDATVDTETTLVDFDYDGVDESVQDGSFEHVTAQPVSDGAGDYLLLAPRDESLSAMADALRRLHGVTDQIVDSVSIDGETVQLEGGTSLGVTAVVGSSQSLERVVLVRGRTEDQVLRTVENLPQLV